MRVRYENLRQEDSANPGNIIARRKLRVEGNIRRPLRCRSHGMHAKIREKVSFSIPLLCMSHFIKFSVTSTASRFVCDYEQLVSRNGTVYESLERYNARLIVDQR